MLETAAQLEQMFTYTVCLLFQSMKSVSIYCQDIFLLGTTCCQFTLLLEFTYSWKPEIRVLLLLNVSSISSYSLSSHLKILD